MENQHSEMNSTIFIRKFDPEEETLYLIHFETDWAVRQIVTTPQGTHFFTEEYPYDNESLHGLTDQPYSSMKSEILPDEIILQKVFEEIWKGKDNG